MNADHKPTAQEIKALSAKNNMRGITALARDWLLIGLAIVLAETLDSPLATLVAIWIIGSQQYALGEVLVHEASHANLFRTRSLNWWLQPLFAWPFFKTVDGYRKWHLPHHTQFGTEGDPIFPRYKELRQNFTTAKAFRIWFIEPLLGPAAWRYVSEDIFDENLKVLLPGLVMNGAALALSIVFGVWPEFLIYWILPHLWVFVAFYHWQEIEDHFACNGTGRNTIGTVRSVLFHNSGHHETHHQFPSIPFYNLPAARHMTDPQRTCTSTGFWESYRQLLDFARKPT